MLHLSDDQLIATLWLPGGALDRKTALGLTETIAALADDRTTRVLCLMARGADFCTGAAPDLDPIDVIPDPASMLASVRIPVVVGIAGACHDVGLELALAGDIRVVSPDATFRLGHLSGGTLPCWGGSQRLARAIRPAEATAMVLLGSALDAGRAMSLGLAHGVADDLGAAVAGLGAQLATVGPLATELAKEAVHRGAELPLRDGLRLEGDLNHQLASSRDRAEALAAFFDKRPPDFAGR